MGLAIIKYFFILMIYLVIQKHCKFYGIVVIMSPENSWKSYLLVC